MSPGQSLAQESIAFLCDRIEAGPDESSIVPIPKTDDQLWNTIKYLWGIEISRYKCCDAHVAPFTAVADAFFARYRVIVCKASRGLGGKSITMAALSLTEAVTLRAGVNLLGGSGEQSRRVLDYMSGVEIPGIFWEHPHAPLHVIRGGYSRGVLLYYTKILGGGYLRALAASQKSVRGPHPQRLRLDEADEMDLALLDAALGQPMSRGSVRGQTLIMSTHQHAQGVMTELIRRCVDKGDQGWKFYEWCYRENLQVHGGWLTDEQVADKRADLTDDMWETEVEGQEPNPGARAIAVDKCKEAFQVALGDYPAAPSEYVQVEDPIKDMGPVGECRRCEHPFDNDEETSCWNCGARRKMKQRAMYATGADWAKRKDWTVIVTLRYDVRPVRCVAFQRFRRLDWPATIGRFEDQYRLYGGTSAHDQTGIGDVIQDYLTIGSTGVWMVGRDRYELLRAYINAIEHGELIFPMLRWMYDEHLLASVDDVFSSTDTSTRHHLPDSFAAGAIAWRAAGLGRVAPIIDPNKGKG